MKVTPETLNNSVDYNVAIKLAQDITVNNVDKYALLDCEWSRDKDSRIFEVGVVDGKGEELFVFLGIDQKHFMSEQQMRELIEVIGSRIIVAYNSSSDYSTIDKNLAYFSLPALTNNHVCAGKMRQAIEKTPRMQKNNGDHSALTDTRTMLSRIEKQAKLEFEHTKTLAELAEESRLISKAKKELNLREKSYNEELAKAVESLEEEFPMISADEFRLERSLSMTKVTLNPGLDLAPILGKFVEQKYVHNGIAIKKAIVEGDPNTITLIDTFFSYEQGWNYSFKFPKK